MYASWKVSSAFWAKSWSQTWIMEPCRSEVSVLWVDWVEYTRTRARAGSGSSRRPSSTSSSAASTVPTSSANWLYCCRYSGSRSFSVRVRAARIAVRGRYTGWNRAKANQASSHKNTRSGLMARHSSITRPTS